MDGQCCCFPIQSQINLSKLIDRFIRVFFNLFLSYFFFSFLIRFQKEVPLVRGEEFDLIESFENTQRRYLIDSSGIFGWDREYWKSDITPLEFDTV